MTCESLEIREAHKVACNKAVVLFEIGNFLEEI